MFKNKLSFNKSMKKEGDNSNAWIIVGVLIGVIIILVIVLFSIISFKEKTKEVTRYYCSINLKNVSCASNYDCRLINGICDLGKWVCVSSNINFDMAFNGTQKDCLALGGNWTLADN